MHTPRGAGRNGRLLAKGPGQIWIVHASVQPVGGPAGLAVSLAPLPAPCSSSPLTASPCPMSLSLSSLSPFIHGPVRSRAIQPEKGSRLLSRRPLRETVCFSLTCCSAWEQLLSQQDQEWPMKNFLSGVWGAAQSRRIPCPKEGLRPGGSGSASPAIPAKSLASPSGSPVLL